MRTHFHSELERLKKRILALGAIVEESVDLAVKAVAEKNVGLAAEIVDRDREIDAQEVRVEEECLKIIALHQPVADELRYLIAMLKINHDLERIGDLSVEVAEQVPHLDHEACLPYENDLADLASKARGQVAESLDAMIHLDGKRAREVWAADDEIDRRNDEICERLRKDLATTPAHVNTIFHLVGISRSFERMGDHATNIAKDVIYMVEGEIARHRGREFKVNGSGQ